MPTEPNTFDEMMERDGFVDVTSAREGTIAHYKHEGYVLHYLETTQKETGKTFVVKVMFPSGTSREDAIQILLNDRDGQGFEPAV